MPTCKNDPKKSYKGDEPSPKGLGYCAHSEEIDKIRKGLDGNTWKITTTSKGIKRWVKYKKDSTKDSTKDLTKISKQQPIHNPKNIINVNKKMDCNKFVIYNKKEKSFFFGTTTVKSIRGILSRKGYIYEMNDFNVINDTETKIPDGYIQQKKLSKSFIKEYYCDSNKQQLSKENDEYLKIKEKHKNDKSYFTHFNGGRPYLVYVGKNIVSIYKESDKYYIKSSNLSKNTVNNKWCYIDLISVFKPEKIFIGKSPKIKMTESSGGHGKNFDGNTILLLLNNNNYILIDGGSIHKFTTKNDKILKYYSPVGNNDVPYPIAIGEKYYYFWNYPDGYLEKKEFPPYKTEKDLQIIIDKGTLYEPFMYCLKKHTKSTTKITLEQFKKK